MYYLGFDIETPPQLNGATRYQIVLVPVWIIVDTYYFALIDTICQSKNLCYQISIETFCLIFQAALSKFRLNDVLLNFDVQVRSIYC